MDSIAEFRITSISCDLMAMISKNSPRQARPVLYSGVKKEILKGLTSTHQEIFHHSKCLHKQYSSQRTPKSSLVQPTDTSSSGISPSSSIKPILLRNVERLNSSTWWINPRNLMERKAPIRLTFLKFKITTLSLVHLTGPFVSMISSIELLPGLKMQLLVLLVRFHLLIHQS
jgi:hypothetical protein